MTKIKIKIFKIIKEIRSPLIIWDRILFYFILLKNKYRKNNYFSISRNEILNVEQFLKIYIDKHITSSVRSVKKEVDLEYEELSKKIKKQNELLTNDIPRIFNADSSLAKICYTIVRFNKPNVIVETGVANGSTSYFILNAIELNGRGLLYSIDLPPLSSNQQIGLLVNKELKINWRLMIGSSLRLLENVSKDVGIIDVFLHDSANIYTIQKYEVRKIYSNLNPKGIIILNNIGTSNAFTELVEELVPSAFYIIEQIDKKENYTGVIIK